MYTSVLYSKYIYSYINKIKNIKVVIKFIYLKEKKYISIIIIYNYCLKKRKSMNIICTLCIVLSLLIDIMNEL